MPTATAPWSSRTASPTRSTTPPSCWLGARKSCSTPPSDRASRSPICAGRSRKRMRFIELGGSQERPSGGAQGSSPRQENAIGGQEGGGRGEKTPAPPGEKDAP